MDSNIKHCIINAALGFWYPKGQQRLIKSLNYHGFSGDVLTWCNEWPNENYDKSCPYNIKAAAFEEAIKLGYTHICWADCSVWAIQNPDLIFDVINAEGYYFWKSGYNCAEVCSDKCLEYFAIDRDLAETYPDTCTGNFGVNVGTEIGKRFIEEWIQSAKDGIFSGSRMHDGQSQDPRFKFHRQDQACASIIANKLGMKMYDPNKYSCYYEPNMNPDVIYVMRGM